MSYPLEEICKNCGLTYGSHHGGTSPWLRNYCPGHERQMDWENGPGTVFKPTDKYEGVKAMSTAVLYKPIDNKLFAITRFYGGKERGVMAQITIDSSCISISVTDIKKVVDILNSVVEYGEKENKND